MEHEMEGDREIVEHGVEKGRDSGIWCGGGQRGWNIRWRGIER